MVGSVRVGLPRDPLRTEELTLIRLLIGETDAAYSGSSEKLSGVTTTPNVPGSWVSAFLSRSSSFVRLAKEGRSSHCREGLGLGLARADAVKLLARDALHLLQTAPLTIPYSVARRRHVRVLALGTRSSIAELSQRLASIVRMTGIEEDHSRAIDDPNRSHGSVACMAGTSQQRALQGIQDVLTPHRGWTSSHLT